MRLALTLITASVLAIAAQAQEVKLNSADDNSEGTTTIQIKKTKGVTEEAKTAEKQWEVQDGTNEIEGEPAAMAKEAHATWTKACNDWKKEFRDDNKENKIISMNCGKAACVGDAGNKTCTSTATYKIKTKIN